MELDDFLKSKVRYHLGFNAGAQIPAGDRARLEEAMALVPDELWYNEIVYHVKRCDIAWKASAAIPDDYFDPDDEGKGRPAPDAPRREWGGVGGGWHPKRVCGTTPDSVAHTG